MVLYSIWEINKLTKTDRKIEMKPINITGYYEFMSASSQNQIVPDDQVTIFFYVLSNI